MPCHQREREFTANPVFKVAGLLGLVATVATGCVTDPKDDVELSFKPAHQTVASGATPELRAAGRVENVGGCGGWYGIWPCFSHRRVEFTGVDSVESDPDGLVRQLGSFPADEDVFWGGGFGVTHHNPRAVAVLADEPGEGEVTVTAKFERYQNDTFDRGVERRATQRMDVVEPNRFERFGGLGPCEPTSDDREVLPFPTRGYLHFYLHVMRNDRPVYVDGNWLKTTANPPIVVEDDGSIEPVPRKPELRREPNIEDPTRYLGRSTTSKNVSRVDYRFQAADGETPREVRMTSKLNEEFERTILVYDVGDIQDLEVDAHQESDRTRIEIAHGLQNHKFTCDGKAVEKRATSETPETCSLRKPDSVGGKEEVEIRSNEFAVVPESEGTCRVWVTLPGASGGDGISTVYETTID